MGKKCNISYHKITNGLLMHALSLEGLVCHGFGCVINHCHCKHKNSSPDLTHIDKAHHPSGFYIMPEECLFFSRCVLVPLQFVVVGQGEVPRTFIRSIQYQPTFAHAKFACRLIIF